MTDYPSNREWFWSVTVYRLSIQRDVSVTGVIEQGNARTREVLVERGILQGALDWIERADMARIRVHHLERNDLDAP